MVDVLSVLPFDLITDLGDLNSLTRLGRISKLYKLVRLTRLVRVFKAVYEKNMIMKYLYNALKLSVALQRLLYLLIMFIVFWHVSTCIW